MQVRLCRHDVRTVLVLDGRRTVLRLRRWRHGRTLLGLDGSTVLRRLCRHEGSTVLRRLCRHVVPHRRGRHDGRGGVGTDGSSESGVGHERRLLLLLRPPLLLEGPQTVVIPGPGIGGVEVVVVVVARHLA